MTPAPVTYETILKNIRDVISKQEVKLRGIPEGDAWLRDLKAAEDIIKLIIMIDEAEAAQVNEADDTAISRFAVAMRYRMRMERSWVNGWEDPAKCSTEDLAKLLRHQVAKGDPVTVANYAMMLWTRGGKTNEGMAG